MTVGGTRSNQRVWPNVASVAQLPNAAAATLQSDLLEVGDLCIVTGGGLYLCTDATLAGATWQPQGNVLWRWNQADTTQFLPAVDLGIGAAIAGLTLGTVAGGPNGTLLRLASTELADGGVIFPIDLVFPRRYVVEITWYGLDFTDVANAGRNLVGAIVAANAAGTAVLAFGHGNITAAAPEQPLLGIAIGAGALFGPSLAFNSVASAQWAAGFGLPQTGLTMRYEINTQRPFVAATPELTATIDGSGSDQGTPTTQARVNGSSRDVAAYPAAWDATTLDTLGLLIGNQGGATTGFTADIESMRVLLHPDDRAPV